MFNCKKKKEKTNKKLRLISYNPISIKRKKKGTRKIPHDTKTGTNKLAKKKNTRTRTRTDTHPHIYRERMYVSISLSAIPLLLIIFILMEIDFQLII